MASCVHSYRDEPALAVALATQAIELAEATADPTALNWAHWERVDAETFQEAQARLPAALALAYRSGADWRVAQLLQLWRSWPSPRDATRRRASSTPRR